MNPLSRSALLAAATLAASAGMGVAQLPGGHTVVGTPEAVAKTQTQAKQIQQADRAPGSKTGTDAQAPVNWRRIRHTAVHYPAPGWSVAEDRRRAKRKRAQARNRRQHRGGGR